MDPKDKEDLTRIEDLPPHEHKPPNLPIEAPEITKIDITQIRPLPTESTTLSSEDWNQPPILDEKKLSDDLLVDDAEPMPFTSPSITMSNTLLRTKIEQIETVNTTSPHFLDLKEEMETFVVKHVPFESYPSYSILIENITSVLQQREIQIILKEYALLQSETEKELVARSLSQKHLLIPRISEYAAIFLANKLQLLDVSVRMAPSDEMIDTFSRDSWNQGILTPESFNHHHEEGQTFLSPDEIILTSLKEFSGKRVLTLGKQLQQMVSIETHRIDQLIKELKTNALQSDFSLLLHDLKEQAAGTGAHAIINLQFQFVTSDTRQSMATLFVTGEAVQLIDDI